MRRISDFQNERAKPQKLANKFVAVEVKKFPSVSANASPVSRVSKAGGEVVDGAGDVFTGRSITLWGYLSGTAVRRKFLLSEESCSYCQMCGLSHSDGPSVMLECLDDSFVGISDLEPVCVTGVMFVRQTGPYSFFDPQAVLVDVTRNSEVQEMS